MVIHVSTENMQEKNFPVTVRLSGEPADGFVSGDALTEPDTVSLYGPESEIGKISRVGITVDIDGASEAQYGTGKVQFFDANDNVAQLSTNVSVSGNKQSKHPVTLFIME